MPVRLRPEQERRLIVDALLALRVRPADADCTADVLVEADLRGYGSHGLARLPLVTDRIRDGSVDPAGQLQAAARAGALVPADWAIDEQGRPTTDPAAGLRGALSPLSGAKGYGLGLLVDAFARLLARSESFDGPDFNLREQPYWWSSFAVVIHIGSLLDPAVFRARVAEYVALLKASPVAPGFAEILVPGERAYRVRRERAQTGIPIEDQI